MKLTKDNIIDIYKNMPGLVVGHGPSFNNVIDKYDKYKEKFIIIETNDWYSFHETAPQYWLMANNIMTIKTEADKINSNLNTTLLYASSVDTTCIKWREAQIKANFFPYVERGMGDPNDIRNILVEYSGIKSRYKGVGTSVVHSLAFSIIMGCNPIYICGVDLDYKKGFAKSKSRTSLANYRPNDLTDFYDVTLEAFRVIKEHADHLGVDIFVTHSNPTYGIFEHKTLEV
jgi:hypothetical protein